MSEAPLLPRKLSNLKLEVLLEVFLVILLIILVVCVVYFLDFLLIRFRPHHVLSSLSFFARLEHFFDVFLVFYFLFLFLKLVQLFPLLVLPDSVLLFPLHFHQFWVEIRKMLQCLFNEQLNVRQEFQVGLRFHVVNLDLILELRYYGVNFRLQICLVLLYYQVVGLTFHGELRNVIAHVVNLLLELVPLIAQLLVLLVYICLFLGDLRFKLIDLLLLVLLHLNQEQVFVL